MILHVDAFARTWVVTHRIAALDQFFLALSSVGRGGLVWLAVAGVFAWRRRRVHTFTLVLLAVLIASALADTIIKPAVGRKRPFEVLGGEVIGGRPRDASFPSGHAANAFAGAATLSRVAPAGAIAWWTLAVAIAFSRVYLGVHFPLDVLGGAAVGLFSAWLAGRLTRFPEF